MPPQGPKPKKPRKDFPLFAHAGGTWAFTFAGKHRHCGPWNDPEGAEAKYHETIAALRDGRAPRPAADGSMSLVTLFNKFLTHYHSKAKAGDITLRSFRDVKTACEAFVISVGKPVRICELRPETFAAYRSQLAARMGAHALNRTITLIKSMFRWAWADDLLAAPIKYGAGFEKAKAKMMRQGKRKRLFTAEEVRKIIDGAGTPLKAMILLALNGGFGNTDVATLPQSAIDFITGLIDYARTKTGVDRRCTIWPETVKAIQEAIAARPKPLDPANDGLCFITAQGRPWVREDAVMKEGRIDGAATADAVNLQFGKLLATLGIWGRSEKGHPKSDGRNFYTLRRTHRTWSDECHDPHAAAKLMGHETGTVAALYVQHIEDSRLRAITDHIHAKIFTSKTESSADQSASGGAGGSARRKSASPGGGSSGRSARRSAK